MDNTTLHIYTAYHLYWVALGTSETQDEWDMFERTLYDMENQHGMDYLGDIIDICEA